MTVFTPNLCSIYISYALIWFEKTIQTTLSKVQLLNANLLIVFWNNLLIVYLLKSLCLDKLVHVMVEIILCHIKLHLFARLVTLVTPYRRKHMLLFRASCIFPVCLIIFKQKNKKMCCIKNLCLINYFTLLYIRAKGSVFWKYSNILIF